MCSLVKSLLRLLQSVTSNFSTHKSHRIQCLNLPRMCHITDMFQTSSLQTFAPLPLRTAYVLLFVCVLLGITEVVFLPGVI